MKNKILLSIFIVLLVFTLVGCSINIPEITQEIEVNIIVTKYWLAISDRQYESAKSYCILNGDAYNLAKEYQDVPYIESSILTFEPCFNYTEINGNNAKVNINLTLTATICFEDICSSESETLNNYSMYLTKIGGIWKLN